jgi:hypothetical protein
MARKTIEVDSDMIDKTLEDLANLYFGLITIQRKPGRNTTQLRKS